MASTAVLVGIILPAFSVGRCQGDEDDRAEAIDRRADAEVRRYFAEWLSAARDGDSDGSLEARRAVKSIGSVAVPALVRLLRSSNDRLEQAFAIQALGELGKAASPAWRIVADFVESDDPALVASAIYALEGIFPDWSYDKIETLTRLTHNSEEFVRNHAILALGNVRPRAKAASAVPVLIDVFENDASNNCRMLAAMSLGSIAPSDPQVVNAFIRAGERGSQSAVEGLLLAGRAAEPAVPLLVRILDGEIDRRPYPAAAMVLGRIGPSAAPAIPALIRRLDSPSTFAEEIELASACATALGEIGVASDEVVRALSRAAEADNVEIRIAAIRAMAALNALRSTADCCDSIGSAIPCGGAKRVLRFPCRRRRVPLTSSE